MTSPGSDPHANEHDVMASDTSTQSAPPVLRVLLTPWWGLFRPRSAAACLIAARPLAFWLTFLLQAAILSGIVVVLVMWDAMVTTIWVPSTTVPTTLATTNPAALAALGYLGTPRTRTRTFTEVWHDWRGYGAIGPAELIFLGVGLLTVAGVLFLAWVSLPFVHRTGSATQSFRRAFRAVISGSGLFIALTGILGIWTVLEDRYGSTRMAPPWILPAFPAAGWLIIAFVGRAIRAAEDSADPTIPPMCEGCGYDLTHRPTDGRCSECGLDVNSSLAPHRHRPGARWERRPTEQSWAFATWEVLFRPRRFYGRLKLRTAPTASRRFQRRHYACITCAAAIWMAAVYVLDTHPQWSAKAGSTAFVTVPSIALPLGAWAILRQRTALAWALRRLRRRKASPTHARPRWIPLARHVILASPYLLLGLALLFLAFPLYAVPNLSRNNLEQLLVIGPTTGLLAALFGWLTHRTVAAVAVTTWIVRKSLPDCRWAAKIIGYESAYLWAFCAYAGSLVTSYIAFNLWISSLVGRKPFVFIYGVPLEVVVLLGGIAALCLLWLWRYRIAGRAIRWSNF